MRAAPMTEIDFFLGVLRFPSFLKTDFADVYSVMSFSNFRKKQKFCLNGRFLTILFSLTDQRSNAKLCQGVDKFLTHYSKPQDIFCENYSISLVT